jgi:hypothetical protein
MKIDNVSFGVTDWDAEDATSLPGEAGYTEWKTKTFSDIRVRRVTYSPGFVANHWCSKGHILFCLSGELHTELADGRKFILSAGMSYQVGDNAEPHRSSAPLGADLFIVD